MITKTRFFVMLNMQDKIPTPMMRTDDYGNDEVALYDTEEAAEADAESNIIGKACGYQIYAWEWPTKFDEAPQ